MDAYRLELSGVSISVVGVHARLSETYCMMVMFMIVCPSQKAMNSDPYHDRVEHLLV